MGSVLNGTHVVWIARATGARHAYMSCQLLDAGVEHTHVLARRRELQIGKTMVSKGTKRRCLASHIVAIHRAREYMERSGDSYVLITEDDASLEEGSALQRPSIREIVRSLPPDWEILQLGYHTYRYEWARIMRSGVAGPVRKGRAPRWSLFAYAVSLRAARALTNATDVMGTFVHVKTAKCIQTADECLMTGQVVGRRWKSYYLQPPMFWEPTTDGVAIFRSTVGSNNLMHAHSSVRSAAWARATYQLRCAPYGCNVDDHNARCADHFYTGAGD